MAKQTTEITHRTDRESLSEAEVMRRTPDHLHRWVAEVSPRGCWIWQGSRSPQGWAGTTSVKGRRRAAYKLIWECVNGQLLNGGYSETLHHLCENGGGACVNPNHLIVVTHSENMRLSTNHPVAINARKTHCIRGHELTPENTYPRPEKTGRGRNGGRGCRECKRLKSREWREKNRERARELQRESYQRAKLDPKRLERIRAKQRRSNAKRRSEHV